VGEAPLTYTHKGHTQRPPKASRTVKLATMRAGDGPRITGRPSTYAARKKNPRCPARPVVSGAAQRRQHRTPTVSSPTDEVLLRACRRPIQRSNTKDQLNVSVPDRHQRNLYPPPTIPSDINSKRLLRFYTTLTLTSLN